MHTQKQTQQYEAIKVYCNAVRDALLNALSADPQNFDRYVSELTVDFQAVTAKYFN